MMEEEDDGEDGDEGMPEDDGADVVTELETLANSDSPDAEEEFSDLMEKTTIDKKKSDSGLYHEHDHDCDIGSELPSVFSDEFFSDMSKAFTNDRIVGLIR